MAPLFCGAARPNSHNNDKLLYNISRLTTFERLEFLILRTCTPNMIYSSIYKAKIIVYQYYKMYFPHSLTFPDIVFRDWPDRHSYPSHMA